MLDKEKKDKKETGGAGVEQNFFAILKCLEIPILAGLFLFISIATFRQIGFEGWYARPGFAATSTFTEDFSATTYKDTTNTTADWYGFGTAGLSATGTFTKGQWQNPKYGQMYMEGISCVDSNTCFMGGNGATVMKTTDGGSTWRLKHDVGTNMGGLVYSSGAVPGIYAIEAVNSSVVYASGRLSSGASSTRGFVIKTEDGGDTWNMVYSETTGKYLYDVDCIDVNTCFVAGGNGSLSGKVVLSTTNGGTNWTSETMPAGTYDLYSVSAYNDGASTTIHAVGGGSSTGTILKGQGSSSFTWIYETSTSTQYFTNVKCTDIGNCIATGGFGQSLPMALFVTHDGGTTWLQKGSPAASSIDALDCAPNATSTCWAGGSAYAGNTYMMKSTDGGNSWSSVASWPANDRILDVYAISDTVAYAGGGVNGTDDPSVVKTTNGTSWSDVWTNCCTNSDFRDIDMISSTTGWTVGSGGYIVKTTDGSTWADILNDGTSMNGVQFIDSSNGWFVGNGGVVKKSSNGGTSFSTQTCAGCNAGHLQEIHMFNANTGYLVGTGGQVRYTTDGGSTGWTAVTSTLNNTTNSWYAVWTVSTTTAYIGGSASSSRGVIYKTTDSGTTWNLQKDIGASTIIASIFCLDSSGTQCWLLNSNGGEVYKTTDGSSWSQVSILGSSGGSGLGEIKFLSSNIGLAAHSTQFFWSRNGGATWSTSSYASENWQAFDIVNDEIWMAGTNESIDYITSTNASSSLARSVAIDSTSGDILCANATVTSSTPGSSSIILEMSNNGGTTWAVASSTNCGGGTGTNFNFSTSGSDLRWRATFNSGSLPTIDMITFLYSTNDAPNTPTNSSPANGATGVLTGPTLTSSAFSDNNSGDTHTTSQWVIADGSGLGAVIQNTGASSTDLTSHTVTGLTSGTTYGWSVKHCDQNGACSASSATTTFTTAAGTGVGTSAGTRTAPSAPVAASSTAISGTAIRWSFKDTSDSEEGFEVKDETGKVVASTQPYFTQNIDHLDETNLSPNHKYCGRRVFSFNGAGSSAPSDIYPCVTTLANPPKAPKVLETFFTEAILAIDPDDGNPTGTEFALYETITKQWVGFVEVFATGTATSTKKYSLGSEAAWQHYGDWGGSKGFVLGELEQGTKYAFVSKARNQNNIVTEMGSSEAPAAIETRISGAKLSVELGVEINSTSKAAGIISTKNIIAAKAANLAGIFVAVSALSVLLYSERLLGPARRGRRRARVSLGRKFVFVFNNRRFVKFSFAAIPTVVIVLFINLFLLAQSKPGVAQVGFADGGKTVTPGTTLVYRAFVKSIGTEVVEDVVLTMPVPAGTEYEKSSIVLDGAVQTDDNDAADNSNFSSSGAKVSLGAMNPDDNHSFYITVKVLPKTKTVSATAVAVAKQFPKGIKSNTVSNSVKANGKPVEETPVVPPAPEEPKGVTPPAPAPAAPKGVKPVILVPKTDEALNNNKPQISGVAAKNAVVDIYLDGDKVGSVDSDQSGKFSFDISKEVSDGEHSLQAVSLGIKSNIIRFKVDTVPAIPSVIEISIVRELPTKDPDAYETTFQISGVSDSGTDEILITISTPEEQTFTYNPETQSWQTYVTAIVEEGLRSITVTDVDAAGNQSSATRVEFTLAPPECGDRLDNDKDGFTDFPGDPGCFATADPSELEEPLPLEIHPQCSDRVDNDNDGLVDYPGDRGCLGAEDNDESDIGEKPLSTVPACADGADNDGDGATDYPSDNGCSGADDRDETNIAERLGVALINGIVDSSRFVAIKVLNNPAVEETNKYAAPAVAAAALANAAGIGGLGTLISWIQLLASQPILLLTGRKKRGYGIVYNSLSKLPVDLATVRLIDAASGRVRGSQVTDKMGRYYFLSEPGSFKIEAIKPGFVFPSPVLLNISSDAQYTDVYHGEQVSVSAGGPISKSIPVDPIDAGLSRDKVLKANRARKFGKLLAASGPILAVVSFLITPKPLYLAMLGAHLVLYGVFGRIAGGLKPKAWGVVRDGKTGAAVPLAVVRIFSRQYNKLLETKVTDSKGRYAFLVGASDYYLTVEKPGYAPAQSHTIEHKDANLPTFVTETIELKPTGNISRPDSAPSRPSEPPAANPSSEPEIFTPPDIPTAGK